jgi:hypothetical protein
MQYMPSLMVRSNDVSRRYLHINPLLKILPPLYLFYLISSFVSFFLFPFIHFISFNSSFVFLFLSLSIYLFFPHLMPRSRMSRSNTSSPPSAFVVCSGTALAFYNLYFKWRSIMCHLISQNKFNAIKYYVTYRVVQKSRNTWGKREISRSSFIKAICYVQKYI